LQNGYKGVIFYQMTERWKTFLCNNCFTNILLIIKDKEITMKTLSNILRFLLALILLIFGLNKILHFLPMEMEPGPGAEFFGALVASGYVIPVIVAVELIAALSLLFNRFIAFTMVLFAPISLNILLYGIFLDPMSLPIGGFTFLLNLYFLITNRKLYCVMFEKE